MLDFFNFFGVSCTLLWKRWCAPISTQLTFTMQKMEFGKSNGLQNALREYRIYLPHFILIWSKPHRCKTYDIICNTIMTYLTHQVKIDKSILVSPTATISITCNAGKIQHTNANKAAPTSFHLFSGWSKSAGTTKGKKCSMRLINHVRYHCITVFQS